MREITINLPPGTDPLFAQALLELDRDSLVDLLLGRGELVDVNVPTKPHPRGRITAAKVEQLQTWAAEAAPLDEIGEFVDIDELLDQAAMFGTINDVLSTLAESDPKAAEILGLSCGFTTGEEMNNREIGLRLGRTGERCRQIRMRGLKKYKKLIAGKLPT